MLRVPLSPALVANDELTPHRAAAVPGNVPATLSSFIGRATEVQQLREALGANRLVTVVGPGGAGKTRLVRELAASIVSLDAARSAYPDGVWWVELAPVQAGAEVVGTVAAAMSVKPTADRLIDEALLDALRAQRMLLVIDNCEHLLADVSHLVDSLLRGAPGLTIVCTSREALSIEGETAWPIRALRRPVERDGISAVEAATFEAVQLFVERARAATPGFSLTDANAPAVITICERLDGLPLALELAAAVVPILGIDALAERIDDALTLLSRGRRTAMPRHRTLHAVLDWSYALLNEEERALLRRLSVFRGSFSLDAMEEVCAIEGSASDLVPALGRLVEHSLIEVLEMDGEARYRLLETVRQFGRSLLRETPEEHAIQGRHARWVARFATGAEAALFSPARGRTVERLRHSIDEIRAAITWATGPGGSRGIALEIGGALGWFWISGVPWAEARRLVATILSAADAEGAPDVERPLAERLALGRLLYPLKGLAFFGGDTAAMLSTGARERVLWDSVDASPVLTPTQRLAADRGRALAEQLDGIAFAMRGEIRQAIDRMDRSVAVAASSGDPWILAVMTMRRALVHFLNGDHRQAATDYDAALVGLRAQGELWFLSLALEGMAMNALALGDSAAAARHARESATALRPEPDPWFISRSLDTMAFVFISQAQAAGATANDQLAAASRLMGAAESLRKRCGAGVIGPDLERNAAMTQTLRARLGDPDYRGTFAAGARLSLADVFDLMDADPILAAATTAAPAVAAVTRAPVRIELRVLGPFAVLRDGVPQQGDTLPMGKGRELLLFFLLHDRVTKDDVGLALWPDSSTAQVRNIFHVTLHHLRRQLGPEHWIVFEQNAYRLDRAPANGLRMEADVDAVLDMSLRVRQMVRRREAPDGTVLDSAREVFERCRSDLAPGLPGGEWLVAAQDRVRASWADGLDALAQLLRASGRHDETVAACELLVAREPLRESAHRILMEALASRGELARALAHYQSLVTTLKREVGAGPSAETRAVADRFR
jgi:non-specific serine/threonine protein kinase